MVIFYTFIIWLINSVVLYSQIINVQITPNTPQVGDSTKVTITQVDTTTTTILPHNTGNLLINKNFCSSNWSGTNITNGTSDLGCNYLTGKGSSSYAETTSPYTSIGITKAEQNLGFTQSASAYVDSWFNNQKTLTISQSVMNLTTGEVITQNRFLSSNTASGNGAGNIAGFIYIPLDNIIINANNNTYSGKLRFDFTSASSNYSGYDVASPNISVSYNKINTQTTSELVTTTEITYCWQNTPSTCPLDTSTQTALTTLQNTNLVIAPTSIVPVQEPVMIKEFVGDPTPYIIQAPPEEKKIIEQQIEQPKQSTEQPKEVNKEQTQNKEESIKEQKSTKEELPTAKESTTVSSSEDKSVKTSVSEEKPVATSTQQEVKTKLTDSKVGTEVKIAEVKVKSVQEIKIDALKVNQPSLSAYESKPFYQQRQMVGVPNPNFFMQLQLEQKPIYVNVNLNDYISKDPLVARQNMLKQIQDEEDDIIIQLEQLRKTKG
jgi:hypothetical protein